MRIWLVSLSPWLLWVVGLLGIALFIFALPSHFEGPVLLHISPGHAVTVVDAVAIVPLLVASTLLFHSLWASRSELREFIGRHPGTSFLATFTGGLGLGLLVASAFSAYFGWWAIGAGLFSFVVLGAGVLVARR